MKTLTDPATAARVARRILFALNERVLASRPAAIPRYCITAKPWLRAIAASDFGLEDPASCVLYALDNLTSWRGDEARTCKKLLIETLSN